MLSKNNSLVLLRGGGDLASGVALRLHRAGIRVAITELAEPLAVRRTVSFSEAVYVEHHSVEGVQARLIKPDQLSAALEAGEIPVLVDPDANILTFDLRPWTFAVVVDARLIKKPPASLPIDIPLHIGLGPGFHAGEDCHTVIETRRSHTLGRVYWAGTTQADSGQPEGDPRRVLRAAADGVLAARAEIGEHVAEGQVVAVIGKQVEVVSPLRGVLRGLIRNGIHVTQGLKIGDVDPRDDAQACYLVSDKALAIGGGALEAILTKMDIRKQLW